MIEAPCGGKPRTDNGGANSVKKIGRHYTERRHVQTKDIALLIQDLKRKGQNAEGSERCHGPPDHNEVISEHSVEVAARYVDMFQIGAQFAELPPAREVGAVRQAGPPEEGPATTIEEWLNAAEYIMSEGNYNVVLCERGIRTFETA